ncbi:MAG TPA: hypothetical protein VMF52_07465 [Steroidobacteraceae bacterium]|nr:hypothetical protein [Steroidobacteraceae bacterium]
MRGIYDIAVYSKSRQLVLLAEVKWVKESSEASATFFRKNLIANHLLPCEPHFLLAYRNEFFLWDAGSSADDPPRFRAPAKSVVKKYLSTVSSAEVAPGPESMESAVKLWLSELVSGIELPDASSEPDKMLVDSGLYEKIKNGEVTRKLH